MADLSLDHDDYSQLPYNARAVARRSLGALVHFATRVLEDGRLSDQEIAEFHTWLRAHPGMATSRPGDRIVLVIERVLADGEVTDAEREELVELLGQHSAPPSSPLGDGARPGGAAGR